MDGGLGLGLGVVVVAFTFVVSQQIYPRLQSEVRGSKTDGLSQKAAIMWRRQYPGHGGPGFKVVVRGVVVEGM